MTRHLGLAVAVALTLALSGAQAAEKYEIKFKKDAQGDRTQNYYTEVNSGKTLIIDGQGNKLVDREESSMYVFLYEENILRRDQDAKNAAELTRKYAVIARTRDGESQKYSYAGKTLNISRDKNGKYGFKIVEGGDLTEADQEELDRDFNRPSGYADHEKMLHPNKAVAIGESWELDRDEMTRSEAMFQFHKEKAQGTGKLVKVYERDGRRFGRIEYRMTLPLKAMKVKDVEIPLADSFLEVSAVDERCIDGTSHANESTGTLKGVLNGQIADPKGNRVTMSTTMTGKIMGRTVDLNVSPDDKLYAIQVKRPTAGDRLQAERKEVATISTRLVDDDGGKLEEKDRKVETIVVYEETCLERPEGSPFATRLRRKYEKAEQTEDRKTSRLSWDGATALYELKDRKLEVRLENEDKFTDPEKIKADLRLHADHSGWRGVLGGGQLVRLNDKWKPRSESIDELALIMRSYEYRKEEFEASAKLIKVYERDGKQFGRVQMSFQVPLRAIKTADGGIPLTNSRVEFEVDVDACIDGSSSSGEMTISMKLVQNSRKTLPDGRLATLKIVTTAEIKDKLSELPKK